MRNIGYLVITVGFLGGSLFTVLDEQYVNWLYFGVTLMVGIAGIVLLRISNKRETHEEGKLSANIENLKISLKNIVVNIKQLNAEKNDINTYDVLHRIDELFPNDLTVFVDARESISYVYGLQAYADVMNNFAAGERYLNRVWSASADGYIDEVNAYLEKAEQQFLEAKEKLNNLNYS